MVNTFPQREYQPMLVGGKNIKGEREKEGKIETKRRKEGKKI
jgi:hypothetical protein